MESSVVVEAMDPLDLAVCRVCGMTLARAHARSGDPALLSGDLGDGDAFDLAIADFAGRVLRIRTNAIAQLGGGCARRRYGSREG